ncbi:MAG: hypothetical protein ABIA93_04020 [Candidatus Woesearchaeota archaeon]
MIILFMCFGLGGGMRTEVEELSFEMIAAMCSSVWKIIEYLL